MKSRNYFVIALISLTLIPLELSWTRIFSAEFFYTFAFLVLSLAILGLGLGALALRLFQSLDKPERLGIYLALAGFAAVIGPLIVFRLGLDFAVLFTSPAMIAKLILTVLILMSSYFLAGMGLALLFKHNHENIPRLYMADLIGAGIGVMTAIWAMNSFGTPVASLLIALPIALGSLMVLNGWKKVIPIVLALLIFTLTPFAGDYLELKRDERAPVIYKHWDAMSKIKLYEYRKEYRGLNIDNIANSPVYAFDGNWEDTKPGETPWGINVSNLIGRFDSCVFLSLGAGGGSDVLQALIEGATEVHAVEINDHINRMMIEGDPGGYLPPIPDTAAINPAAGPDSGATAPDTVGRIVTLAEFSGYIYNDPRVKVVTEDARAYVRRFENKFDVIYSLSSNTWAALASGSFALAENYLFTTEAFKDYWTALSDSGFLMMEHQVYVPRLVSEVIDALRQTGVDNPLEHFAVYDLPKMRRKIILLSKQPLTKEIRYSALGELTPEKFEQIHLLYPPADDSLQNNLINRIIVEGWQNVADSAPIDISPVTDNKPFVAQLGLWRNLTTEKLDKISFFAEFQGFPLSKVMMVIILAVVIVVILPLNLIPYFRKGPKLKAIPWLYFFVIGAAFMAVEIILIQKYGLLIGPSLYSLAAVLLTLLIASGIGSRFSKSFSNTFAFSAVAGWLLLDAFVFPSMIYAAGDMTMVPRLALAALLILPLGFFMGMPFPKGTLKVGELIDWGFAVNGAASVLGSILILFVVFAWGFNTGLALSAAMYLIAYGLISLKRAW